MQTKQPKHLYSGRASRRGLQAAGAAGLLAGLACASSVQAAGLTIEPADNPASVAGLTLDLECDDLVVNGTLNASNAVFQRVGNVIIGATGSLTAPNADFQITNTWQNNGDFTGAGSTVTASMACANTSTAISGNTSFNNFSATEPGLTLNFAAGSEQTVSGLLILHDVTLLGDGGAAYLSLQPSGGQGIGSVGVDGVDASRGQHLAPTQVNQISGSAVNWFSNPTPPVRPVTPVPTTGPVGLSLMGLLLGAAAFFRRRCLTSKAC